VHFYGYYLEIRSRTFLLFAAWSAVIFVSYSFKEIVLNTLTTIFLTETVSFIFTDVTEVFSVHIHFCLFFANQILLLFLVYHALLFVLPSLTSSESNFSVFVSLISVFLVFLSVLVYHAFLFPLSWHFFLSFQSFGALKTFSLDFEAKLSDFSTFYTKFYFICVMYFQFFLIPILVLKYVKTNFHLYSSFRKPLCYFCVIFSTVVTPPDVLSQIVLSFFSVLCCEILVYFSILKKRFALVRKPIKAN
jgi:sec-independent protein translocase protein TatC